MDMYTGPRRCEQGHRGCGSAGRSMPMSTIGWRLFLPGPLVSAAVLDKLSLPNINSKRPLNRLQFLHVGTTIRP